MATLSFRLQSNDLTAEAFNDAVKNAQKLTEGMENVQSAAFKLGEDGSVSIGRVTVATKETDKGLKGLQQTILETQFAFERLSNVSARISRATADFTSNNIQAALSLDTIKTGLTAVLGSAEAVEAQFQRLLVVAQQPGLGLPEAAKAVGALQSVRVESDLAFRSVAALGNAVARSGGDRGAFARASRALTEIAGKTQLYKGEINQLNNAINETNKVLEIAFGTFNLDEIRDQISNTHEFVERFVGALEQLDSVADSTANQIENFGDSLFQTRAAFGQAILPAFSQLLKLGDQALTFFRGLPESARETIAWGAVVTSAFAGITAIATGFVAILPAITTGLATLGISFTALLGPIGLVTAAIAGVTLGVVAVTRELRNEKTATDELVESVNNLAKAKNQLATSEDAEIERLRNLAAKRREVQTEINNTTEELAKLRRQHEQFEGVQAPSGMAGRGLRSRRAGLESAIEQRIATLDRLFAARTQIDIALQRQPEESRAVDPFAPTFGPIEGVAALNARTRRSAQQLEARRQRDRDRQAARQKREQDRAAREAQSQAERQAREEQRLADETLRNEQEMIRLTIEENARANKEITTSTTQRHNQLSQIAFNNARIAIQLTNDRFEQERQQVELSANMQAQAITQTLNDERTITAERIALREQLSLIGQRLAADLAEIERKERKEVEKTNEARQKQLDIITKTVRNINRLSRDREVTPASPDFRRSLRPVALQLTAIPQDFAFELQARRELSETLHRDLLDLERDTAARREEIQESQHRTAAEKALEIEEIERDSAEKRLRIERELAESRATVGQTALDSLKNFAFGVLDAITQRLQQQAATGILDLLLGSGSSGPGLHSGLLTGGSAKLAGLSTLIPGGQILLPALGIGAALGLRGLFDDPTHDLIARNQGRRIGQSVSVHSQQSALDLSRLTAEGFAEGVRMGNGATVGNRSAGLVNEIRKLAEAMADRNAQPITIEPIFAFDMIQFIERNKPNLQDQGIV